MSAHALLSPSAAHRWINCPPSARYCEDIPDKTSDYADEGSLAHKLCEVTAKLKFTGLMKKEYNAALKAIKKDRLWNDEMLSTAEKYVEHLTERSMEFDSAPYMAFEVKFDIGDYVPESFGTCDCVMIGGDRLIITDYKHGKGVAVSAEDNPQLMLYALGVLKHYAATYGGAIKRVSMFIDQPRLEDYNGHELTVEELLDWGANICKPAALLAFSGFGKFSEGHWCRFCPAKAVCRHRAENNTALEDFAEICGVEQLKAKSPTLTDDEIGDLLKRAETLIEWHKALKEYVYEKLLEGGSIPGWKLVAGRSIREWNVPADDAIQAILNAGYDKALVYDYSPKSLAQLEKVIGSSVFNEKFGSMVYKPPGKPTLAKEASSRPAIDGAANDFKDIITEG